MEVIESPVTKKAPNSRPKIDYDSIYPHFLAGISFRALAEKFNVSAESLMKYGRNHNWESKRQELELSAKIRKPDLDPIKTAQMLVEYRQKYIQNVSKASANVSESLVEKVESVKTFEDKALAMSQFKPAADIGKAIFGIGSESPSSLQVNFLSNLDLQDVQVIDVTNKVTKKELEE